MHIFSYRIPFRYHRKGSLDLACRILCPVYGKPVLCQCALSFFLHITSYIYIVLLYIELLILIVVELSLMIFCGPKYGRGDNYLLPNFYSFCRFLWSQTQEALCKLLSVSTAWLVESHLGSSHWGCCSLGLIQRYGFYRLLSHLSIRSFIKKFFLGCSFWKCNCYSLNYFYVYWTASCHC